MTSPGPKYDAAANYQRMAGENERLRGLVTYREQTIEKLKAELDSNNRAFQRLIPDAERAEELEDRLAQAEEIIRAHNRLEWAMFNSDLEATWPTEAGELERAYQQRHGVDLSGEPAERGGTA